MSPYGYLSPYGPGSGDDHFPTITGSQRPDVRSLMGYGGFTAESGRQTARQERQMLTLMYGPTVRRKAEFGDGQVVLRQCIRPRRGDSLLRAPMARVVSH